MGNVFRFILLPSMVVVVSTLAIRLFEYDPNASLLSLSSPETYQGTSIRTDGQYFRSSMFLDSKLNQSLLYFIHSDSLEKYQRYLEDWTLTICSRVNDSCWTKHWKHSSLPEWTSTFYPCEIYKPKHCPLSTGVCVLWGKKGCVISKKARWQ